MWTGKAKCEGMLGDFILPMLFIVAGWTELGVSTS